MRFSCGSPSIRVSVVALLLALAGCVSTKHTSPLGGCLVNFASGDRVLMAEVPGLSGYESSKLYQTLEKITKEKGVLPAYAAEQEMELRLHQVKPSGDTASLAALQKLGYTYYLRVQVEGKETTEGYTHTTAQEKREAASNVAPPSFRKDDDVTSARLTFSLYATDERRLAYTLITKTEMRPLPIPDHDGDEHAVNLSTSSMAIQKAMTKGVKKLFESCK
jgi:tRNA(Leu) C34 or U34 (ribose-2'-O)-methylase TrmL